jgi:hypothetical protein
MERLGYKNLQEFDEMLQELQRILKGFVLHAAWSGCGGDFFRMKGLIRTMRHTLEQNQHPEMWEDCTSCGGSGLADTRTSSVRTSSVRTCWRCLGSGKTRKD